MKKHYKILAASWFMAAAAFVSAPALAECVLCNPAKNGDLDKLNARLEGGADI